jgi:hypothetical protein
LVAIFESGNRSGPVGVVVGYEERFEPVEYVRVAVDRVRIHAWSGHSPVLFLGPAVLVAVLGAFRYRRRLHQFSRRPAAAVATAAGIAVVASAANTAVQMGQALARTGPTLAAVLTLVFVLVPLGVGWWAVSVAPETPDRRRRLGLGLAALLAFVMWSGYVVAPLALLAAALAPARWFDDVTRAAR